MIKDVTVYVKNNGNQDHIVEIAANFAKANDACLTGLYIKNDAVNQYYTYEHLSEEFMKKILQQENDRSESHKERFNRQCSKVECTNNWLSIWESDEAYGYIYYSDVVFIERDDSESTFLFNKSSFVNYLMLESGRPVMVIPSKWKQKSIGKNILFAWNESRESVRAMHEALPLMQQADNVYVVSVDDNRDSHRRLATGMEITGYLSRRHVRSSLEVKDANNTPLSVGEVLLEHAAKYNIDLIVMGGYSHSRLREILLGGVTRTMFNHSEVPLFIVH